MEMPSGKARKTHIFARFAPTPQKNTPRGNTRKHDGIAHGDLPFWRKSGKLSKKAFK